MHASELSLQMVLLTMAKGMTTLSKFASFPAHHWRHGFVL
jgi:hypothetical protein